jgi:hypothetical protein
MKARRGMAGVWLGYCVLYVKSRKNTWKLWYLELQGTHSHKTTCSSVEVS